MKNNENDYVPKTTVVPQITVDAFQRDLSMNKKQGLDMQTTVKKNQVVAISNSASKNDSAHKGSNVDQKKEQKTPAQEDSNDISVAFSDEEDYKRDQ